LRTSGKALLAACVALAGCWDEELPEQPVDGTIVIPSDQVADIREVGPVFVGIFESFDPHQLGYPYPSTAPRVGDQPVGDALPYGGTTLGSYAFGCYRALQCGIVTGRYSSLEDILEVNPVETDDGSFASDEDLFDQCTWYYGWNSLAEFTFVGDDKLDFRKNDDGDWEADFRTWRTQTPDGAIVWAFADNDFTSCSTDAGTVNRRRGEDGNYFREGTNFTDVLNLPDKYITAGDWVVSQPDTIEEGRLDGYSVTLDYVKD
jgi:hypothetical protein